MKGRAKGCKHKIVIEPSMARTPIDIHVSPSRSARNALTRAIRGVALRASCAVRAPLPARAVNALRKRAALDLSPQP
jgi:hypothetical protein